MVTQFDSIWMSLSCYDTETLNYQIIEFKMYYYISKLTVSRIFSEFSHWHVFSGTYSVDIMPY